MNVDQFKDPVCYLCHCGAVVSSLSLMQEAVGLSTAIIFIFEKKMSLNLLNSVKTFRKNSNLISNSEKFKIAQFDNK